MNKKLIAVAVAGVVAAPVASADITAYGRIDNHLVFSKASGGKSMQDMTTGTSRFGFKGSGDLGNGMSAFARYEFSANTDNATGGGSGIGRRLGFVGLDGSFGKISLGQQWSAYYQNFGTHMSLNISQGPAQAMGPFRTGNTIQYANSFGPISLKADVRVDDAEDGNGNGFGIGATINPMDNVALAIAFDTSDMMDMPAEGAMPAVTNRDRDTLGVVGSVSMGMFSITASYEQQEDEMDMKNKSSTLWLGAGLTDKLSAKLGYQSTEVKHYHGTDSKGPDKVGETDKISANVTYLLGGGARVYGEFTNAEFTHSTMTGKNSDKDTFILGVRLDF